MDYRNQENPTEVDTLEMILILIEWCNENIDKIKYNRSILYIYI